LLIARSALETQSGYGELRYFRFSPITVVFLLMRTGIEDADDPLTTKSMEVLQMAEENSTRLNLVQPILDDDGFPRMVTLYRGSREVAAVGAADGEDAAKQVCILVLKQDGGLRVGDVIQVSRI
jgi:hypothetical protein